MRRLRVGCEFDYDAVVDTPSVFQVQPHDPPRVDVRYEKWAADPEMTRHGYHDLYGNPCMRVVLPAGSSSLRYDALVEVPDATEDADENAAELKPEALPDDVLIYTLPSRYVLPDVLGDEAWSRFGALPADYRRVQAI
ncbi:MAG TPA: hypothetical protein VF892_14980, partial [Pseudonocardiaceae bacterium]